MVSTKQCIVWKGKTCSNGRYGRIEGTKKITMAHRYIWENIYGEIPKGMCVCHKCDNGLCINPKHLFLGTQKDNVKDMFDKRRARGQFINQKGENNANARYTKKFIDSIRDFYSKTPRSYQIIAEKFGLKSKGHAHAIINNLVWKDWESYKCII